MIKKQRIKKQSFKKKGLQQAEKAMALFILLALPTCLFAEFDHSSWDKLLRKHVYTIEEGVATQVDYSGMAADRAVLKSYLFNIGTVQRDSFDNWAESAQLAFLINTYNAWTVELILGEYPEIDSIRDIGFILSSAWRQQIASLFGEQVSLDDIEHGMIRGWNRYQEPRIHFAVNCAAIGCPALRGEAYDGGKLDQQLEENTRLFLSDRSRNYFSDGRLYISSIFDWYQEDFEQGWQGIDSVGRFLANYADALQLDSATVARLRKDDGIRIRHLRYDWNLNDTP